ncbi:MAG: hypothetical protein ABF285_12065, partial [Pacificibacter sp.]
RQTDDFGRRFEIFEWIMCCHQPELRISRLPVKFVLQCRLEAFVGREKFHWQQWNRLSTKIQIRKLLHLDLNETKHFIDRPSR